MGEITYDAVSATFTVSGGGHAYQSRGAFNVSVTIVPNGGTVVTVDDTAQVNAPPQPTPPTPPPGSSNERYVTAVYEAVLERAPTAAELQNWASGLDAGLPRDAFVSSLDHSAEYFANRVVTPDYLKYLGRSPDETGLAFWVDQLRYGALTDEQLEAGFIGSPEYYARAGGTDRAWVDAMFENLLGRAPDAQGENYWVNQLAQGASKSAVAYGFAGSVERETQRVTDDYFGYLGRAPDAAGLNYWVNQFTSGAQTNEDLITGFLSAWEYYQEHST
jgi:hypothetical protein